MATGVDITADFVRRLRENGRAAADIGNAARVATEAGSPGVALGSIVSKYVWFYRKVRNGGDWDLKNTAYRPYRAQGVIVCGVQYSADMPGNFHYGFVGKAIDIDDAVLLRAAAEAQQRAGTSRPEFWCTGGDDPADAGFIELGIRLYRNVGLAVTETALRHVLAAFTPRVCGPRR